MSAGAAPIPDEYLADPGRYFLEWVPRVLAQQPDLGERFGRAGEIAQIHLTGDRGGWWHFVLAGGRVDVRAGRHERPSFTVTMDVDVWRGLRRGDRNGLVELLRGRIRLSGSKRALLRVGRLLG